MNSKILIDWNQVPMITVKLPVNDRFDAYEVPYENLEDARDKLVHVFVNSGPFALIARGDLGTYEIHTMDIYTVLDNILHLFGDEKNRRLDFENHIKSLKSLIHNNIKNGVAPYYGEPRGYSSGEWVNPDSVG